MKREPIFRGIICIALTAAIVTGLLPWTALSEEMALDVPEQEASEDAALVAQSDSVRSIRPVVAGALGSATQGRVDVSGCGFTTDEFRATYKKVISEDPGLFYALDTCTVWKQNSKAVSFEPAYGPTHYNGISVSAAEASAMRDKWNEGMADLMSWVPGDGSDMQKVKAVHDWLCWNVEYDYASYNSDDYKWWDYTSYGALVERRSVCSGYAETFSAAMRLLGIPCVKVSAHNHAWNRVYVNGSWFHVDAAWDSCWTAKRSIGAEAPSANWFMKSDAGIRERDRVHSSYFRNDGVITHADYGEHAAGEDSSYDSFADEDWPSYSAPLPSNCVQVFLLSETSIALCVGQEEQLDVVLPSGMGVNAAATTWSSSDMSVAYVSAGGRLEAVRPGEAIVTCRLGSATRQCSVTVVDSAHAKQGASVTIVDDYAQMFRLYNPNSGEHFYTASDGERDTLAALGWSYEGVGWFAPAVSSTRVYRLYNPVAGEHHYTMSAGERDMLVGVGWNYEGIGWYSDDSRTMPLFRDYNPNAFANNHNYTVSPSEHGYLSAVGWRDEGIGWYGM